MKHPRVFDSYVATFVAKIPKRFERPLVWITNCGGGWFATTTLIAMGVAALISENHQLLEQTLIMAILSPLAELTKFITRRKRPETLYVEQMKIKTYSFPSGHSYASALIAGFLSSLAVIYIGSPLDWVVAAALACFALLVGISRVYLGAHFPSDVLAGWLLAIIVLYLTTPLRSTLA